MRIFGDYYIPLFFFVFVFWVILFQIAIKRNKTSVGDDVAAFIERERLAEHTIKRGFTDFPFFKPDINRLPVKDYTDKKYADSRYDRVKKRQQSVLNRASQDMVRFDKAYTNADLKLKYGKNNFERVMIYEERFNGYARSLLDWASELFKLDEREEARLVLEAALELDCGLGAVYTMLADIYNEGGKKAELKALYEKTLNASLLTKDKTLEYINKYLE